MSGAYIQMDFETARKLKWERGKTEHRLNNETFTGDPCEELFQEFCDAYNYVLVLESSGVELPGYRTTIRNMALALQERSRELKRRM